MRVLFHFLSRWPLRLLHGLGDLIGWILWLLPKGRRNVAMRNIDLCLPDLPAAQRRRIARASVQHEVKTVLEMPVIWLGDATRVLGLIREWRNKHLLDEALAHGKGMILLTLHQGNWEAPAIPFSKDYTATGLYKPQPGATIDALSLIGRCRFGGKMLPAEGGVGRKLIDILARNETVYFMPDQDPPPGRGVYAPFFGVAAHTPTLVAKLVQQTGARVVFFYGERLPRGAGFIAHFFAAPEAIYSPDLETSVAGMNAGLEQCARDCLEQYWWGYKRFRRRPAGEPRLYD
ncbi:MAG TPA: lysophospholipid acyltransferase family protein [Solimonas sp.]